MTAQRRALSLPVLVLCFAGATAPMACAGAQKAPKSQAELTRDAARAFAAAEVEYEDHNWEYARQLMDDVRRNYGYTTYARKAQMRLADIAYEQARFPEAVAEYKAYVHDHPNDASVPYARLRVIRAHFEQSSGTVFQPPVEERDLTPTREAYTEVRAFLADYPNYQPHDELVYIYHSVSGLLARHELYVARFYLKQGRFNAAMRRVQFSLRTYSDSGLEPESTVLLGEIYLKMGEPRRARAMFTHIIERFPDSAFRAPAEKFLAHMDASGHPTEGNERPHPS